MLLFALLLIFAIGQQVRGYAQRLAAGIAPTILAEVEKRLERRIRYDRIHLKEPGLAVVEGLRVSRGLDAEDTAFASAERLELRFDPGLQHWSSLLTRGIGRDTRARLAVRRLRVLQPDGSLFLDAESASARFDLAPLLAGKSDVLETVGPVSIKAPQIRIRRDRRGKWNYEDLLPKRKEEKPWQFHTTLVASSARIDLWNERAGRLPGPQHSRFVGSVQVGFAAHPVVKFGLKGELTDGPAERGIRRPLWAEGHVDGKQGTWLIHAKARSDQPQYWYDYISTTPVDTLRIRRGTVHADLTAWSHSRGATPEYQAVLAVSGGELELKSFPQLLSRIRGRVQLNRAAAVVDGSLQVSGLPVVAAGEIVLGPRPQTRLRLRSERVTTDWIRTNFPQVRLPSTLEVPHPVSVLAAVTGSDAYWSVEGTAATPFVRQHDREGGILAEIERVDAAYRGTYRAGETLRLDGEVRATSGHIRGLPLQALTSRFGLREKWLQLAAEGQLLEGTAHVKGWIDLEKAPAEFYVVGEARHLRPELWPQPEARTRISGGVTAQFAASGTLETPRVSAHVEAAPLNIGEESLEKLAGRVQFEDGELRIPYAVVEQRGQRAHVSGTIAADGHLGLQVTARDLDLRRLLSGRTKEKVSGQAYVAAQVTGTTATPQVSGQIQVYRPALADRPDLAADYAEAEFAWDGEAALRLSEVLLERTPVTLYAPSLELTRQPSEGGSHTAELEWRVRSQVEVQGLTLTQALRLGGISMERLKAAPLSGSLENFTLGIEGFLDQPQVSFRLQGTKVAFQQFDIGVVSAAGRVDLAQSRVRVDRFHTESPQFQSDGSGEVAWNSDAPLEERADHARLDLRLTLGGLRLAPLLQRFAPEVATYATVSATLQQALVRVTGTASAPLVEGNLTVASLIVNERAVPLEPFRLQWNREVAVLHGVEARLGSGYLRIPHLVAWLEGRKPGSHLLEWLAGRVEVDAVPVAVIEQLVQDSPFYSRRSLDALREALDQWTTPISGRVRAVLSAPVGPGAFPATLAEVGKVMRARAEPQVTGELSVPDLASPPESDAPLIRLASHFSYRPGRLEIADLTLSQDPEATLSLSGFLVEPSGDDPGSLSASVRAEKLKVSSLARLPIRGLEDRLKPIQPVDGLAGFTLIVSGSARLPHLKLNLVVDEPILSGVPFDEFALEGAEYSAKEGRLRAASARLVKRLPSGESQVRVIGSLPLTWPRFIVPADAPRELTVLIPEQSLSVLNDLAAESEALAAERGGENPSRMAPVVAALRQIAATRGRMEGRITLGGTREVPANDGFFRLADATLQVEGLETEIREVNVRVDLREDQLELTHLTGKSNHGGSITGSGTVTLGAAAGVPASARLDIRLSVDQFKFVEKKVASLLGEAFKGTQTRGVLQSVSRTAVREPAAIRISGDLRRPMITGAVRLDDSTTLLAYDPVFSEPRVSEPGGPNVDLNLVIGNNVWLRNPQARLKLSEGVRVSQTLGAPVVNGEIRVLEGTIPLPGLRLRNVEGVLRIAYDGRGQGAGSEGRTSLYVDLTAASTVRLHRSVALEAEDYDLEFVIRGTPGTGGEGTIRPAGVSGGLLLGGDGGLTITVRTDPPLPAGEIEALIRQHFGVEGFGGNGSNVVEALRTQIEQAVAANLSSALTGRIEDALQSALGLSVFAIDVGVSQPLRIRLGRQLFGKLYGTVTQQFGSAEGDNPTRYEVYYRLTPRVRVGYRQEEPLGLRVFFFSGGISF